MNLSRRISRRRFLEHTSLTLGASTLLPNLTQGENTRPPNIIFIIVDDMGWADLGCYGQTAYATPNLDRMAAEGIRFEQAYSGCTVCAPARCTLMTGKHMGHAAVRGNTGGIPLPASETTIATRLKEAGYQCGGFGKWGLGDLDTEGAPEHHGFDEFFGYYHQIHAHYFYPDYLIDTGNKVPLPENAEFYDRHGDRRGGVPEGPEDDPYTFSHSMIVERMKQFIRSNADQPFFCYAPWTPPHARYEIPENDEAWQAVKDKDWPVDAKTHAAFNLMVDRHVGETFQLLDELDLASNTIVLFCSDNGASMRFEGTLDSSGPLTGRKRSMHEGGIRVPMIAHWPGQIEAGSVSSHPLYFPDVFPTLLELATGRTTEPDDIDGLSFCPTLFNRADEQQSHEVMYWEWPTYNWRRGEYVDLMQAIRVGDWKVLRHQSGEAWRLYNVVEDPSEANDLAGQYPERVDELVALGERHRTEMPPQIEPEKPEGQRYR